MGAPALPTQDYLWEGSAEPGERANERAAMSTMLVDIWKAELRLPMLPCVCPLLVQSCKELLVAQPASFPARECAPLRWVLRPAKPWRGIQRNVGILLCLPQEQAE